MAVSPSNIENIKLWWGWLHRNHKATFTIKAGWPSGLGRDWIVDQMIAGSNPDIVFCNIF